MNSKKFIVFVNTLIFTLAFNIPILLQRYMNYKVAGDKAFYAFLSEFIFAMGFVYPVLYCCSIRKLFLRVFLVFLYIISGLAAFFIYNLNILINSEIIASFFEASQSEVASFLSVDLILAIVCSVALAFINILSVNKACFDVEQDRKLSFITLVFVVACLLGDADWGGNILPYNALKETGQYFLEKSEIVKKRLDIAEAYDYSIDTNLSEDLNVVLIIGESGRKDHFSLGGYHKLTNPLLAKEQNNLIYFKDVTACYPLTRTAVPCMITRATRENRTISAKETSFIGVFRKLGFYTSWLGMQGTYTAIDAPYFDLAKESNKFLLLGTDVEVFSSNDASLFPFVDEFLKEHPKGKNLLILHTYGSHFHYEERYTDEFRKYTPTCSKKRFLTDMTHCSLEERINSYDNSILFTDYFIKTIIDKFRDKKAIIIFTPDHGESLGEEGRFLHGTYNAGEQIAVPMLFWLSDKYIKAFPDYATNLQKSINKSIMHDHLFHSILGCSGIKSGIIENRLNLCGRAAS